MVDIIQLDENIHIDDYESVAFLSKSVKDLKEKAKSILPHLKDRTIWMVNSSAHGGGVAEMLPRVVSLLRDLGLDVRWAVIQTDQSDFFRITKNIHNLIHDNGEINLGQKQREVYESVNRKNADDLKSRLNPGDILIVHDPQPMALGKMLQSEADIHTIWRSHIGAASETERTRHAWEFLRPYADGYDRAVFTSDKYVADFFKDNYRIIHPAIDPFSHKNRDLEPVKIMGILCNSGLAKPRHPVLTSPFEKTAMRMKKDGNFDSAVQPEEIGLMYRMVVTQISRWDRLKGFLPLMKGFAEMKRRCRDRSDSEWDCPRHKKLMSIVRLVLAGPDPESIQDDPEGEEVLAELKKAYREFPERIQEDIVLLALPMDSRKRNSLMVNVLQRVSSVVVQNSLQEGFGLTATEAMWKRKPVLASNASGLLEQIEDGRNGSVNPDPMNETAIAEKLETLLRRGTDRERLGGNAQRTVYSRFLVFTQVGDWLETMKEVVEQKGRVA